MKLRKNEEIKKQNEEESKVIWVTPEMAKEWLSKNVRNRTLKPKHIIQYTQDMLNGDWYCSNDAITFDSHGALTNGQNRLQAIIKSGTTQKFLVAYGIAHNVNMDRGAMRTIADNIKIFTDLPLDCIDTYIVAMCKFILDYLGYNTRNANIIAEFMEYYKIQISDFFTAVPIGGCTKYRTAPCLAAFFLAYVNGVPAHLLDKMKIAFVTGEYYFPDYDVETFKPMIKLAQIANRTSSKTIRQKRELFLRTMFAINGVQTGKGRTRNMPIRNIVYNINYNGKKLSM